ncbi:MAG TPA: hypothetical protein VGM33_12705 [Baekduia sp.]
MTITILYLTDYERHALDSLIQVDAVMVGEAITHAKDAGDLAAALEDAAAHLQRLRAYELGHLTLDDPTEARLRDRRAEVLTEIAYEERCLRDPTAGWLGLTAEQSAAKTRAEIDRLLDEANGIDSILTRAGGPNDQAMAA